jgi:hypothetical protein
MARTKAALIAQRSLRFTGTGPTGQAAARAMYATTDAGPKLPGVQPVPMPRKPPARTKGSSSWNA